MCIRLQFDLNVVRNNAINIYKYISMDHQVNALTAKKGKHTLY